MRPLARHLALFLLALAGLATGASAQEQAYWQRDVFDWMEPGPLAGRNGWAVSGGASALVAVMSGSKALALGEAVGAPVAMVRSISVTGPSQRLQFRLRFAGRVPSQLARLDLETGRLLGGSSRFLSFELGRELRVTSPAGGSLSLVASTVEDRWYDLRVELDLSAGLARVQVDGLGPSTIRLPATPPDRLRLSAASGPGSVFLADIFGFKPETLAALPAPDHPLDFGYYHVDARWGEYGSSVDRYTNTRRVDLSGFTDAAADASSWTAQVQQALHRAMRSGKRIHLALDQQGCRSPDDCGFRLADVLAAAEPFWPFVTSLELADEPNWGRYEVEWRLTDLRERLASRGLSAPPLGVVFSRETMLASEAPLADGLDWVGIEAYVDPPGSPSSGANLAELYLTLQQAKSRVPADKQIVYIMQGYDRNGEWWDEGTLAALQLPVYQLAANDSRVRGIHVFSYARYGGTHAYPSLQARHEAIGAAIAQWNSPPSIALLQPGDGAAAPVAPVRIQASAADADGSVRRVEFFVGPALVGADTASSYEWTWEPPGPGVYALAARVFDDRGAASLSPVATISVGSPVPPALAIDDVAVDASAGVEKARFTVSLSAASAEPVRVDYATADGSALAGRDYLAASGVASFAPGVVSQPISVVIPRGAAFLGSRSFTVSLSKPAGATVADASGQGTILRPPDPLVGDVDGAGMSGDFDGDGRAEIAVYRRSTGEWLLRLSSDRRLWGASWGDSRLPDVPVPADFDGDGKADVAVYRSTTGEWLHLRSSDGRPGGGISWGSPAQGDVPVVSDYDGDGQADHAVYRRSTGEWFIRDAHLPPPDDLVYVAWGSPAYRDEPVPADYDGDGKSDVAVYRRATGEWLIRDTRRRASGELVYVAWGSPAHQDEPVPADYDGDGVRDVAVYRRATGEWFIRRSTDGRLLYVPWGSVADQDKPVPADYDGDGAADVAVYRRLTGEWFIRRSADLGLEYQPWGAPSLGDVPVLGRRPFPP